MRAELANLNHCAVPFLSRTDVNLSCYDSTCICMATSYGGTCKWTLDIGHRTVNTGRSLTEKDLLKDRAEYYFTKLFSLDFPLSFSYFSFPKYDKSRPLFSKR